MPFYNCIYFLNKFINTMCMGFGCNAVGVLGSRIIESKRERLIAILTNVLVPCNGRFPTMIAIISIFFVGTVISPYNSLMVAFFLVLVILLGIFLTLMLSKLLSMTFLKGMPSSFTLELPAYRRPKFLKTIFSSIINKGVFVLCRAVLVAIPAGIVIWLMGNITVNGTSILNLFISMLNPIGELMGLDGTILAGFILGFPANEIVMPIIIMAYTNTGYMIELDSLLALKSLLINNGWTITTAISMIIFSLCHFPCGTTLWTIKKETGEIKWTLLSFILPTILGIVLCIIFNTIVHIFI